MWERVIILLALHAFWHCGVARAQVSSDSGGITVSGSGEVKAKPNHVEIDLRIASTAELTDDALVKYQDAKKRTLEAFSALAMKNLKVHDRALTLSPGNAQELMQQAMNGEVVKPTKLQIQVASTLCLELSDIAKTPPEEVMKTIGKLLDVAQDSGAAFGPTAADINMAYRYGRQPNSTIVRFVLRDVAGIREMAYANAVADARARAERLAKLNKVTLGRAVAVQEIQVSGDEAPAQPNVDPFGQASDDATPAQTITSEIFAEIPFRVKLSVRFAIESPAPKTALR